MIAISMDGRDAFGLFLKQNADLEPGEPHAKAEVRAALTKGKVLVGGASQINAKRVVEHGFVAVGG